MKTTPSSQFEFSKYKYASAFDAKEEIHIPYNAKGIKSKDFTITTDNMNSLRSIGIDVDAIVQYQEEHPNFKGLIQDYNDKHRSGNIASAMDTLQPMLTTPNTSTPIQFLQNYMPGFVFTITWPRNIDEFTGIFITGRFEDAQVVQPISEIIGSSIPYGDFQNTNNQGWNVNFNIATVVRYEADLEIGMLETLEAARMNYDVASAKRKGALLQNEITRNAIGFSGVNNGANQTYGFLNAPGQPAYINFPLGASGFSEWSTLTYTELTTDIITMAAALMNQTNGLVDATTMPTTLALSTNTVQYLQTVPQFGNSVMTFIRETYPKMRIVQAPQLNFANGGLNVADLYAEHVDDLSTDDGRTFVQMVPTKMRALGIKQEVKGYWEGYAMATAGVMCKRPLFIVRFTGN